MGEITTSLVDWSRGQFALTAMYHWLFVPLTLGLSMIMAICETIYYRTKNDLWLRITKFWITLFGVNFAIGVATGIILEFQFGTNWSNYSWFVGDIFGPPLAIEGILAFFLEAVFSAVMFFGWNRVSKGFHLLSTWMTGIGATLSALWILIANAWMQYPTGVTFNPQTVRNEMTDFFGVAASPVAINKFFHTVLSSWTLGAAFVICVCCWFLIKNKNIQLALKSIMVASIFGFFAMLLTLFTGDSTAKLVARVQPMKLAAMEGLYKGDTNQSIVAFGVLNSSKKYDNDEETFHFAIKLPDVLSWLAYGKADAFVAGIDDIIKGGYEAEDVHGNKYMMPSIDERIESGKTAIDALVGYRTAMAEGDNLLANKHKEVLLDNYHNYGYGYVTDVSQIIPPVSYTFYAFHLMVIFGFYFFILFIVIYFVLGRKKYQKPGGFNPKNKKWLMYIGMFSLPFAYIMSQCGWITSEMGRQPWTIQDILPTFISTSKLAVGTVQTTFFMFLILFTVLLVADIMIIARQIRKENVDETDNNEEAY